MSFNKWFVIFAAFVITVLMNCDANATVFRAPICLDKHQHNIDCPPRDRRPAEVGRAANRRLYDQLNLRLTEAVVIDMRNGWFRVMYKPQWTKDSGHIGETYCVVRLQDYSDGWYKPEDSDWRYYLSIDEASCKNQEDLLKAAEDVIPFRAYKSVQCDSSFINRCLDGVWLWSEFIAQITAEPINDKTLEIVGYLDTAEMRDRLAKHYKKLGNRPSPPILVDEYTHLDGNICARYAFVGIMCRTGSDNETKMTRVFPDDRWYEKIWLPDKYR